jgi:glycosyltransferase involved in cell wall biosynthesis
VKDRLSIAHVLSSFGMGGQERVALDLARAQRRAGHDVLAFSLAPEPHGPLADEFRAAGARVVSAPKGRGVDLGLVPQLAATFLLEHVDVVHTHNPQPLIYAAPAGRIARCAVIHSKHGINPDRGRKLLLRRAAARFAHLYVAVSALTAQASRAAREVPEAKLRVVDNGVDLSRFPGEDVEARAALRAEWGIPGEAFVVGTVGRLAAEKDHALLVRAAGRILQDGGALHVVLVGGGDQEAALRAQIAALGEAAARSIHLVGLRRDVPRCLAAFDVFALPSKTEGLPLVLPEAMAMHLPVVATAVGGVPNVVREGETGFLVPPGAGADAALAARFLELAGDPAKRRAFGARARAVALAEYSAERMAADYMALYREVRGEGARAQVSA